MGLTKTELAKELPKVIQVELVDIGKQFTFYDDFIQRRTTASVPPESRARTQLCMAADFIQSQGDLSIPRNVWSRISSFIDHQATVCVFDWGGERLTVSFFL